MEESQFLNTDGLVDLIEEIRMRAWARLNYRRLTQRSGEGHPIVLEEMRRKDRESA